MKRLVLRIAALGVVVVLGVIAIAHAQRASDPASPSGEPGSEANARLANGAPRPFLAPVNASVNPLRDARRVAAADQVPPPIVQTSSTLPGSDGASGAFRKGTVPFSSDENRDSPPLAARDRNVAPLDDTDNSMPSDDGVARSVGRTSRTPVANLLRPPAAAPADAAAPPVEQGAASAAEIPDAAAVPTLQPRRAAAEEDNRYPQARTLAAPGQVRTLAGPPSAGATPPPVDRYGAAARGADRYVAPQREAADAEEPAPLRADPFATPATPASAAKAAPADATAASRTTWPSVAASNSVPPALRKGTVPDQSSVGAPSDENRDSPQPAPGELPSAGLIPVNRMASPAVESGEPAPSGEGSGRPGEKQLEGPQSPQLTIQKFAPAEIQVGKPATFRVVVRNTGSVPASAVEIHDQIPKGTQVVNTTPRASRGSHGELVWTLGTIKPGDDATVEVQLMPVAEGEIGSVATVVFNADASARCVATRPQLVVETAAPQKVLIGDQTTLTITVSNPGTGVATGVVIEERIPAGLQQPDHPGEAGLEYAVGDLRPGESRKLDLILVAKQPGPITNVLAVRGDGNLRAESKCNLEVTAPQLDIALDGPKKRYLERQATYQVSLRNPGTAAAERIDLVAYLPPGLKFVSANNYGHYDEASRAVSWRLAELPANQADKVELVTLPVEAGQHNIKLTSTASKGLKVEKEQPVLIEGIAAILFQASSTVNPVVVGGETTYEIHVVNQGSKAATNVRMAVTLPPELKPLGAEGPTRNNVEGSRVLFDGLASLAPKADTTYRVRAQAIRPGDLRTRVQLMTDEMTSPVTKEESTRVYADE